MRFDELTKADQNIIEGHLIATAKATVTFVISDVTLLGAFSGCGGPGRRSYD